MQLSDRLKSSILSAVILGAAIFAAVPAYGATTFTPIRVNAGGSAYTDSLGQTWSADTGSSGGSADNCGCSVSGTKDPTIYESERWGTFTYSFAAPTGSYSVTLKFAETSFSASGQRVFNVAINGTSVLSKFDIFASAGGANIAIDKTFNVNSTGTVSISFTRGTADYPNINGIQIVSAAATPTITTQPANQTVTSGQKATFSIAATGGTLSYQWMKNGASISGATSSSYTTPATTSSDNGSTFTAAVSNSAGSVTSSAATLTVNTSSGSGSGSGSSSFTPIRVVAGGSAYTDSLGQKWSADTGFSGGNAWNCGCQITGTPDPTLYQSQRWGVFSYSFAAPTGSYAVTLKFAEGFTAAGDREFNVSINGATVLSNFDIFVAAGGTNIAVDKTFTVNSTGTIAINFQQGPDDYPMVDAIQIVAASSGSGTSGTASLGVSANSVSFGSVSTASSASQKVTLTNTGTMNVTISNVMVSGAGFSSSGVPNGQILTPGQTATLTATFAPSSAGSATGTISISSNAATQTISLLGTGVSTTSHSVTLTWTPSSSGSISGYNVYSSTTSGGPYAKLNGSPTSITSYTDVTVQASKTYYYVVTTVNSQGTESGYSNQVKVAVP